MMTYSYTTGEARECLYATFNTAWTDPVVGWQSVLGALASDDPGLPVVVWDDDEPEDDAEITQPTVYAYVRHTTAGQDSLRGECGRTFKRTGFILLRLHVPTNGSLKTADGLSNVIQNAFMGKRGVGAGAGIWFRSVRPIEQGKSKDRYRIDIIASFEYIELL